jgi:hypothetical protein
MIESFEITKELDKSEAQIKSADNFLIYDNPQLGIRTQHPNDWITEERQGDSENSHIIAFLSQSDDSFEDRIIIEIKNLSAEGNIVLDNYVHKHIEDLIRKTPKSLHFTLIESIPILISGSPGKKIIYKIESEPGVERKTSEVILVNNHKLYNIIYVIEANSYDTYLPITQKIVESFQIIS